ncbi:hypothetical protein HF285_15475 [Acidithiobacillus ferrooxidans F221]|uniref:hypothetical protein n=1 Tax=Acidithiobacillus ferrooxidans TaxID=920 RepID=UPI001C06C42B|nr:hypothetical protein [Acidithiobacillus ferrooxidans]MBU2809616.1 hypothetical protein [Acidithiobacillus ferrooxidans F221]
MNPRDSEVLLYQTDDGATRVEVRIASETAWRNQNQMADLFLTTKQYAGQHLRNVFAEGDQAPETVVKEFFWANPAVAQLPGQGFCARCGYLARGGAFAMMEAPVVPDRFP